MKSDQHLKFICTHCNESIDLDFKGGRCRLCGFTPRISGGVISFVDAQSDKWFASWEAFAQTSEGETSKGADYRFEGLQKTIIDGLRRTCRVPSPAALGLDVGCGSGAFWKSAFDATNILGVDYSPAMCDLARRKGMRVFNADAKSLPFESSQFQLVYSAELLQYFEDPGPLLAELSRVARVGGQVVVSTLNRTSVQRRAIGALLKALRGNRSFDPVALHAAAAIQQSAQGLPLALCSVRWIFFPIGGIRTTTRTDSVFGPLATNFIIEFVKAGI